MSDCTRGSGSGNGDSPTDPHSYASESSPPAVDDDSQALSHHKKQRASKRAKRAQVSRACLRCRRLQKGCSESRPCQRCVKVGLGDQCVAAAGKAQSAKLHLPDPDDSSATSPPQLSPVAGLPIISSLDLPISPQAFTSFPASLSRGIGICCPAIYVESLRKRITESSESGVEAYCVLVGMCAMVFIQVEEPGSRRFSHVVGVDTNAAYGWTLLEEALAAHRNLARRSNPTLEHVLFTFFIYACHAALLHHSQAFFFLRETTTLFLLLDLDTFQDPCRTIAGRLFWVLVVSERSHAIRYRRPITLQITPSSPPADSSILGIHDPQALAGFQCLIALFRPLDSSFIATYNGENLSSPHSPGALDDIEIKICGALSLTPPSALQDTQIANLGVTQLWLRAILWQVRLRLGHLSEDLAGTELVPANYTYQYPLDIARDVVASIRGLDLECLAVHGGGFTEKLFDVTSAAINVVARIPVDSDRQDAVEHIRYLRHRIHRLPGGNRIYSKLLDKHLLTALPGLDTLDIDSFSSDG
ncbi:hypothetical protein PG987_011482 [Apiospora arundinis]